MSQPSGTAKKHLNSPLWPHPVWSVHGEGGDSGKPAPRHTPVGFAAQQCEAYRLPLRTCRATQISKERPKRPKEVSAHGLHIAKHPSLARQQDADDFASSRFQQKMVRWRLQAFIHIVLEHIIPCITSFKDATFFAEAHLIAVVIGIGICTLGTWPKGIPYDRAHSY